MRYQVVYSKMGVSHTVIFDDLDSARRFAAGVVVAGFVDVMIFEKSESGLREISA